MPELSERLGVPYNNLIKLVQKMSRANIVKTRQGKYGGVELGQPPKSITLKTVVHLIDGPIQLTECMNGKLSGCVLSKQCKLKEKFRIIQTKVDDMMEEITISELVYK